TRSTKTSDGLAAIQAQLNNLGREIKKVNVKVYGAQVGCELCKGPHYTKDCPLKEEGKTIEEAYYTQFGLPFQQGGQYRVAATRFYQRNNGNPSSLNQGFGDSYRANEQEEGSYGLKDLDAYSIRTTLLDDALPLNEKDPRRLGKLAPTKLIVELADKTVKHPKGIAENMLVGIDKFVFPVDFIVLDMPKDIKTPLILGRPLLSTAHAKIDVFKKKIALRVGNDHDVFRSDKPASNIIKRVYVLSLRERMELDLEARLMGEALILDRSQDHDFGDFLELNDLNH
ncbi:putative reverse transcriptase domain-containing protein, partial [Tanacetum coccineum]